MNRHFAAVIVFGIALVAVLGVARSMGQPGPTGSAPAAPAEACHPVAVLDLVRIFDECTQIKDLNDQIRLKTEEISKEATQRREVIESKQIELTAFTPGKPDYETRRKELMRLNIEANVWFKMEEEAMEREKFNWTRTIYERAVSVAGQVAREHGYDVVLQRTEFKPSEIEQSVQILRRVLHERSVVYHVPEIDITDLVIRRLDAAYKAAGGTSQLGATAKPTP